MGSNFVFDQPHYDALNTAREATLRQLLESLRKDLELQNAVDVGCGLGHFAVFLRNLGFDVLALDGRQENVNEAKLNFAWQTRKIEEFKSLGSSTLSSV